jgi:hypothetical protein
VRAAGDREEPWLSEIRVYRRGDFTGDDLTATESHGDATGVPEHVAQDQKSAIAGEPICQSHKAKGGDDGESPE